MIKLPSINKLKATLTTSTLKVTRDKMMNGKTESEMILNMIVIDNISFHLTSFTLLSVVTLLLSSSYSDRKCPGHGLDTSEKWLQCVSGQVTLHDHLHQIILIIHTWTHVRVFLVINRGGAKYDIENNEYRDHDLCF